MLLGRFETGSVSEGSERPASHRLLAEALGGGVRADRTLAVGGVLLRRPGSSRARRASRLQDRRRASELRSAVRRWDREGPHRRERLSRRAARRAPGLLDCVEPSLVDGGVRSLVEVHKKRFSVVSIPELLMVTSRPCIREFLFGTAFPRRVLGEEFFVDTPPKKGRDVVPVSVGRRAGEFIAVDSFFQVTCVLTHL